MDFLSKLLGTDTQKKSAESEIKALEGYQELARARMAVAKEIAMPYVACANFLRLFMSVPEVFFPIDFIASRIAKATFVIKRYSDDSVVWNRNKMIKVLSQPNCLMTWSEMVYMHFVYKYCTGNAYIRAAMPEAFAKGKKYKMCDHFWPLPADDVRVVPAATAIPLFGMCERSELISGYSLEAFGNANIRIPEFQVYHDRDGKPEFDNEMFMRSKSRLLSVLKPISNLIAVYEARNVIYVKRGGLGFLVNMKTDAAGSSALTPKEKAELQEEMRKYGVGEGQYPMGLTDVPLAFIRTNLSIADLQPFEETLEDAVKIAGAFNIPAVLVPRKDQSTFSNQDTALKSVYSGVIIPEAKDFCSDLTIFLGLDQDGYYLDADFSDVDCLQQGLKESEEVKKLINDRCLMQFNNGIITLNDWRAQIHESQIEDDELFNKLKFQMTDEDLARVEKIIKSNNNNITITNQQKPSTGDEQRQQRNQEEPDLRDQGE